jgi:ADP-L-glycero-D-manno-heptose 6-epimerase
MEHNGRFMLENNYRRSKDLLDACREQGARLLYASSAATYGNSDVFREQPEYEQPLNVYGYSKLLFDNVVRRALPDTRSQIAGFRYFNVYGPREEHKGRMASVAFHHFKQYRDVGNVALFGEYAGYEPGMQSRDFVFVDDVVAVNLWFAQNPQASGIFNLGTGRAQPFNDVAHAVVNACRRLDGKSPLTLLQQVSSGLIKYIPFPGALVGKYQSYTEADIAALRGVGCDVPFVDVATGIDRYVEWLAAEKA